MKVRDQALDPVLKIPSIQMRYLVEENAAPCAFGGGELVLHDQIQNALRTGEDVSMNRYLLIELEHLRHVSGNQIASLIILACVRLHDSGCDLEKSRFARTIASDQTDALSFQDRDRRLVEH